MHTCAWACHYTCNTNTHRHQKRSYSATLIILMHWKSSSTCLERKSSWRDSKGEHLFMEASRNTHLIACANVLQISWWPGCDQRPDWWVLDSHGVQRQRDHIPCVHPPSSWSWWHTTCEFLSYEHFTHCCEMFLVILWAYVLFVCLCVCTGAEKETHWKRHCCHCIPGTYNDVHYSCAAYKKQPCIIHFSHCHSLTPSLLTGWEHPVLSKHGPFPLHPWLHRGTSGTSQHRPHCLQGFHGSQTRGSRFWTPDSRSSRLSEGNWI